MNGLLNPVKKQVRLIKKAVFYRAKVKKRNISSEKVSKFQVLAVAGEHF